MTGPQSRYESIIDQQIRMAQERGDFDDLPGMGKPLPGRGTEDDDLWWVTQFVNREGISGEAALPVSMRLAKEIERLPDTVRDLLSEQAVRESVCDLNERIAAYLRAPTGPHVPVRPVDPDRAVAQWREARGRPAGDRSGAEPTGRGRSEPGVRSPSRQDEPTPATAPSRRRRWFGRRTAG